jgi:hypothetical protein
LRCLTEDESKIFGRMVSIDLDIAGSPHSEIKHSVPSDLLDHVTEKG